MNGIFSHLLALHVVAVQVKEALLGAHQVVKGALLLDGLGAHEHDVVALGQVLSWTVSK